MDFNSLKFTQVVDDINDEIRNLIKEKKSVPEPVFHKAAMCFGAAVLEKNPFYADRALILCQMYNFPLTKTMQDVVVAASLSRVAGSPLGTNDQISRKQRNNEVSLWTAHLIAAGCDIKEASQKAAEMYANTYPNQKPKKASSISREYESLTKETNIQPDINEMHRNDKSLNQIWKEAAVNVPRTADHKGERR